MPKKGKPEEVNTGLTVDLPIDLDDVPDLNIPPGMYAAQISSVTLTKSKADNPMAVLEFTLTTGDYEGRKTFGRYVMTEQGLIFFKPVVKACGLRQADLEVSPGKYDLSPLKGKVVNVRIRLRRDGDGEETELGGVYNL